MRVRSCCGCCSLQTGSLIIGILSLIGCAIQLIVTCIATATLQAQYEIATNQNNFNTILNNNGHSFNNNYQNIQDIQNIQKSSAEASKLVILSISKGFMAAIISYTVIGLIISGFHVYGTIKRNVDHVYPFVYLCFSNIPVTIVVAVGYMTGMGSLGIIPAGAIVLVFFIFAGALALQIYIWLVIFCFYREITAEKYGHSPNGGKVYQQSLNSV